MKINLSTLANDKSSEQRSKKTEEKIFFLNPFQQKRFCKSFKTFPIQRKVKKNRRSKPHPPEKNPGKGECLSENCKKQERLIYLSEKRYQETMSLPTGNFRDALLGISSDDSRFVRKKQRRNRAAIAKHPIPTRCFATRSSQSRLTIAQHVRQRSIV